MPVLLTEEGQDDILARLILAEASSLRVGLHTANAGAAKSVTLAQLTAATFSGYLAQTPVWAAIADSAAGRSRMEAGELTFTHNGGATSNILIGWHLWNITSGKLWYYEPFGVSLVMDSSGDNVKLKPTIYFGDLTPPL